jgi:hypothetical protein
MGDKNPKKAPKKKMEKKPVQVENQEKKLQK